LAGDRPTSRRSRRFVLTGIIIALFAVTALLLSPRFQSWLVRRALARVHEPWQLAFDRLGVGPTGLSATGLNFSMPGVSATSAPLTIRVAPTRLLSQRELSIERIEAQKIRVVLTPEEFASSSSQPFEGLLRLLQVPLRWQLDAAHLDGEMIVQEGGASRAVGHFSLRGGGLGPASVGNFAYELTANSMILPPGPNHEFSSRGTIRFTQTPAHGIGRIELDGDLRLPAYGLFTLPAGSIHTVLEATPNGETYRAEIIFKDAATLNVTADLDATRHQGFAKLTVHASQALLAPLLHERVPQAAAEGSADVTFDLARGDWKLSLQEKLSASHLELASDALAGMKGASFNGNVSLKAEKHGERVTVHVFDAALHDQSEASFHLTLPQILELSSWLHPDHATPPEDIAIHADLAHAPLRWLSGLSSTAAPALETAECEGSWDVKLDPQHRIHIAPTAATKLTGLRPQSIGATKLPELQLAFWPSVAVTSDRLSADLHHIELTSQHGDRVRGNISVAQVAIGHEVVSQGSLQASLPSLLRNAQGALPISLNTGWEASLADGALRVDQFSLDAQEVTQPTSDQPRRQADNTETSDAVFDSPLQQHIRVSIASKRAFTVLLATGKLAEAAPSLPTSHVGAHEADSNDGLLALSLDHAPLAWAAPSLSGSLSGKLSLLDPAGSVSAELKAEALFPSSKGSVAQPIQVTLNAHLHPVTSRIFAADTFSSTASGSGVTATLTAPEPFLFGLSNSGSVVCSTLQSLKLHLDQLSLAELKPWLPNLILNGSLAPSDFLLTARQTHYTFEAASPLHVEHLSEVSAQTGTALFRDGEISFSPHAELDFLCETRPTFQFAYQGRIGVTHGTVLEGHRPFLSVDGSVGFKGNERIFLADTLDLDGDLHLESLPHLNRVPRTGELSIHAHGDLLGDRPLAVSAALSNVALDQKSLPRLTFALEGKVSSDLVLDGRTQLELATTPVASNVMFEAKLNLVDGKLNIASGLHSQFLDLTAFEDMSRAFAPMPIATTANTAKKSAKAPVRSGHSNTGGNLEDSTPPFWGDLRGSFDLDLARVDFAPYRIDGIAGRVKADDRTLQLKALTGKMFAGRWGGDVMISHEPEAADGDHRLTANFDILQFESARVVQTVFPNQLSSVDAKIDVHTRVQSHGNSLRALIDQSQVDFSVMGAGGVLHLAVPKADTLASAAVFGGTILLSPELRALGRLIRKLSEMPMDRLSIVGQRNAGGEISIAELVFDSPQLQLHGHGQIAEVVGEPLMNRPLALSLTLAAKDELAVILDGMRLLTKGNSHEGFRPLRQPITIGGRTGSPDTTPLYDLFAQAVSGSHGTWGVLMRHLQTQVKKR
jgi:hypothetical protein